MSQTQRTPHVRIAILSGFPAVAETLGFDAGVALTEAGIDSALLAEPDNRLPVARVSRLLADATKATGRRDIGLLLSQTVGFDRLGLTGLLACGRPTVAAAVQAIIGFSQLHNEALHMWVEPAGAQMLLREEYLTGPDVETDQLVQFSAGVIAGILRTLIADDWRPQRASFRCAAPDDTTSYARIFDCPLSFDADFDGLTIAAPDFARPNRLRSADPANYLQRVRQLLGGSASASTLRLVTHLIWSLLPTGDCTATRIAQLIGYDRRTLHRHLGEHGQTFSQVLTAVRRELAARHLSLGSRSLSDIAQLLGFRSQSDFSHWFRREFATAPTHWRRK